MKNRFNPEVFLQLCIFTGTAALLLLALVSGKIRYYIHPRLDIYVWFSVFALLLIGFFLLPGLFKPKRGLHLAPYIIFLIPMISALVLPPTTTGSSAVELGSSKLSSPGQQQQFQLRDKTPPAPQESSGSNEKKDPVSQEQAKTKQPENNDNVQVVGDEDFAEWLFEVSENMEQFDGKQVQFKGQVVRIEEFAENEFVPARMGMVCCAADVQPLGFLCRYDQAGKWKDGQWVWVTATIKIEEYNGEPMPILYASNIIEAEKPVEEYIYPYY